MIFRSCFNQSCFIQTVTHYLKAYHRLAFVEAFQTFAKVTLQTFPLFLFWSRQALPQFWGWYSASSAADRKQMQLCYPWKFVFQQSLGGACLCQGCYWWRSSASWYCPGYSSWSGVAAVFIAAAAMPTASSTSKLSSLTFLRTATVIGLIALFALHCSAKGYYGYASTAACCWNLMSHRWCCNGAEPTTTAHYAAAF